MFEKINTESKKNTQSLFFGCCPTQIYHHSILWVLNNQMKIDGLYHFYEAKDHLSHEKIIKVLNINRFICQLTVLFRQKKKWNKELFVADNLLKFLTITSINYNYKFTRYILSESTCTVSYQWPVLTPVPRRDINISYRTCLSLVVKQIKFRFQLCVNIHVFYSSRYIP